MILFSELPKIYAPQSSMKAEISLNLVGSGPHIAFSCDIKVLCLDISLLRFW
jgi:hypothetical protein